MYVYKLWPQVKKSLAMRRKQEKKKQMAVNSRASSRFFSSVLIIKEASSSKFSLSFSIYQNDYIYIYISEQRVAVTLDAWFDFF